MNILLDYMFPITSIEPTPEASTAFLKQVLVIGKPKDGTVTEDVITRLTSAATASNYFGAAASAEVTQLFNAGMAKVSVLPSADINVAAELVGKESDFYTILLSSDYADADVAAADFGDFDGVVGVASTDDTFLMAQATIENRSAWHTTGANDGKNMFYAFGKLLSNALNWRNQQYITVPLADDVDTLGEAESYFDDKINFVISDSEFGNRVGLFVAGGKAIVAPYIKRNLQVDMQSAALGYLAGNQPGYTKTHAALLEDELQKVVDEYIETQWIEDGTVEVELRQNNFIASGDINIAEPKALWRIFAEMKATL